MANLEHKQQMSTADFAVMVIAATFGSQFILQTRNLIADAEQLAWLSVVLGGLACYAAACLMLALGRRFPGDSPVSYLPRLWGPFFGNVILLWFVMVFIDMFWLGMAGFSHVVTFFMLERTPPEVVTLGMLAVLVYLSLQDLGTIIRVQMFVTLVAIPIVTGVWLLSIFNFQPDYMLPLWPLKMKGILAGAVDSWSLYGGYELVLLFLPFVCRQNTRPARAVGWAFFCVTLLFVSTVVLSVGVLTSDAAVNTPYPTMIVIRSVELPGTFVERLENYLLFAWMPAVFSSLTMFLYIPALVCTQRWGHADHRPWVLLLAPIMFTGSVLLDNSKIIQQINEFSIAVALGFSFIIIPLSLFLSWRRDKKKEG
ncbi:MAG TPA: GerAB/ArcD/ProY family transporter [Negativicutes bacterium]